MSVHVASYGGGLNSKWMIAKWVLEKNPLHIVLFADTGREDAEKPETYADVKLFGEWLMYRGVPCQWVRVTGESLYQNSLRRGVLPAIAYGFRTCSQRWKIEPQEKFLNRWVVSKEAWARGEKIIRLVGFDAGESRRAKPFEDAKYINRYWLVERGEDREACEAGLISIGLPVPPKSSCHYCPQMKQHEIVSLNPAQQESALALEAKALPNLTTIKGLGRKFSWESVLRGQCEVTDNAIEAPCGCYDG